jgi:uncharacterized protein YprB with RNaseH-like and TPR domain
LVIVEVLLIAWSGIEDSLLIALKKKECSYKEINTLIPNRGMDALRNRYYVLQRLQNNQWIQNQILGVLDIETTDLTSNYGFIISWAVALENGKVISDCISKKDIDSEGFDKRIVASLIAELEKLDVVVGYYSKRFDLPFIRSRALYWRLPFPAPGTIKHIDLYDAVKHKLRLQRNSLEQATKFLQIPGKSHVEYALWLKAAYGNPKALGYILRHNQADVRITLKLYQRLKAVVKFTRGAL